MEDKNGKKPQRPTYPECPTSGKNNHPAEKCWRRAWAHVCPKRTRPDDKANGFSGDEGTCSARRSVIRKQQLQANQLPESLTQKTKFATTSNMYPNVDRTIFHNRPSKLNLQASPI